MRAKTRKWGILLAGLVLLLLASWWALPFVTQWYLNRSLNHVEGYRGQVGRVGLHHLLRGAFVVHDIEIRKASGNVYLPFFSVRRLDFALQWSELLRGHIVAKVNLYSPRVNFVQGPSAAQSQVEVQKEWQEVVRDLTPIRINHFGIHDGALHFVSPHRKPPVDLSLKQVEVTAKNLTNSRTKGETYFATIDVTGKATGNGNLKIHAKADPLTKPLPSFRLALELTGVDLRALNPFFQAYGKFDVERGRFDFYFEMDSNPKTYKGYAKPMLSHIDVLDWERDAQKKNFLQIVWESLVGTAVEIFKNKPADRLATKAPFSGTWKTTDVAIFETVLNLLRNAFVRALLPGLEGNAAQK